MDQIDESRAILTAKALRVQLDAHHPDPDVILSASRIIRHAGMVAYPTETFYGIASNPFDARAVERLFSAKGRPGGQPLILLLSHVDQASDVALLSGLVKARYERLARHLWPGPLTLVLPVRPRLVCPALAGGRTVAVRMSSHPVAWQLVRTVGHPITSTSANLSGAAPAASADGIDRNLSACLDLILDAGPTAGVLPSTLLDISAQRPILLRAGAVPLERIADLLGVRPRAGGVAA